MTPTAPVGKETCRCCGEEIKEEDYEETCEACECIVHRDCADHTDYEGKSYLVCADCLDNGSFEECFSDE